MTEVELDQLFDAARETQADPDMAPSAALMARIMADAEAEIAAQQAPEVFAGTATAKSGLLGMIKEALGGWRGMAGVATAGVAGLAIGLGAPDMVTEFTLGTGTGTATETISADTGLDGLTSSFYDLALEG